MKIENITITRVHIDDNIYCDVVPNKNNSNVYDFWLYHENYDASLYMFSCFAENENKMTELIQNNAGEYIQDLLKKCESETIPLF